MLLQKYEYLTVSPGSREYREYLALRHEVFCEELRRVPASGRRAAGVLVESDEYDVHSVHVLCRSKDSGAVVGCSRLILPGSNGLNVKARYRLSHDLTAVSAEVGEIGRLTLAHTLRRYRSGNPLPEGKRGGANPARAVERRDGPAVALGLYREIFRLAGAYGIAYCYAAMEPALARLLNRLGFPFHEAGPLNNDVRPARQPYVIGAQATRSALAATNTWLYQFMFGAEDSVAVQTVGAWPSLLSMPAMRPQALSIAAA